MVGHGSVWDVCVFILCLETLLNSLVLKSWSDPIRLFIYLLFWKAEWERERERVGETEWGSLHLQVHSPNGCSSKVCARPAPGAGSPWESPMWVAEIQWLWLPRGMSERLDWKQGAPIWAERVSASCSTHCATVLASTPCDSQSCNLETRGVLFPFIMTLIRISSAMVRRNNKSRYPCLICSLKEKVLVFHKQMLKVFCGCFW